MLPPGGLAAFLSGVPALISPPGAVAAMVLLFGAYAIVDGIFNLIAAVRPPDGRRWWPLAIEGVVSLAAGLVTFFWPGLTALALAMVIAAWSLITGVAELAAAIRLRKQLEHEWLLGLMGLLSIIFRVLLFLAPGVGLVVIAIWIGAYAIVFGALLTALAFKLRAWAHSHAPEPTPRTA